MVFKRREGVISIDGRKEWICKFCSASTVAGKDGVDGEVATSGSASERESRWAKESPHR